MREEELKNRIAQDYFKEYNCTKIIGNVDFCVCRQQNQQELFEPESLFWAEAKKGSSDIYKAIVQLILTIGKARTFDKYLPPAFLGAFDSEKIAFIPYWDIQEIFYQNDFNWNVTPSNHETKEFQKLYEQVKTILEKNSLQFSFEQDGKEIHLFIKTNFITGKTEASKIQIDKNNFIFVYHKWRISVKPTISIMDWDKARKNKILEVDFYVADLLSQENETFKPDLYVLLKKDHYELERNIDEIGLFSSSTVGFSDNQKAHHEFWNKYQRPPKEIYWNFIVERRDLLVPQDVRERKGSFFTPQIWVELSQKYLARVFGEDWQEEYYIWDCAAGTGNLLTGLINKYNIWASTLDRQDVDVMKDRIKNGANLLAEHVFQFDFLNDDLSKLPKNLQDIINNPQERKKLIIYINPPYTETNATKGTEKGKNSRKIGVNLTKQRDKYEYFLGKAKRELYTQFMVRTYHEIPDCTLALFSKLKTLNAPFYNTFREHFLAKLETCFIIPADTFDNVKGKFPIGFQIWNTSKKEKFTEIQTDIYAWNGILIGKKNFCPYENTKYINNWIIEQRFKNIKENIGKIFAVGSDFQHQSNCRLNSQNVPKQAGFTIIDVCLQNLTECVIYFAVRHCIKATWLNDRDQFLYPNEGWKTDTEFQNNCLAYTLFHGQNKITSKDGINHWIPFTEQEIQAKERFQSHCMSDFILGKNKRENKKPLLFSLEATEVFNAGRELWKYYHAQPNNNANASFYDIKEYFQGRSKEGKMHAYSKNDTYTKLITTMRETMEALEKKIQPKVYEYDFLKE